MSKNWRNSIGPLLALVTAAVGQVVMSTALDSCLDLSSASPVSQRLAFTSYYAQLVSEPAGGSLLRVVLLGQSSTSGGAFNSETNLLPTIVASSQVLTFPIAGNSSALCSAIRGPTLSSMTSTAGSASESSSSGCPYAAGELAVGVAIPLPASYAYTTVTTQLLFLDSSSPALTLACYNLAVTPYYPSLVPYRVLFYIPIALVASLMLALVAARTYAARTDVIHEQEAHLASSLTLKLSHPTARQFRWVRTWYAAWSGRQVIASGSLRRFVTPEMVELLALLIQFTLVATVAVDWPNFVYPILTQATWPALIYNSTLPFVARGAPLFPTGFAPPAAFATQMSDPTSPLFFNTSSPGMLLDLQGSAMGMERWARTVGVSSTSLFSICATLFCSLVASVVAIHLILYLASLLASIVSPSTLRYRVRRPRLPEINSDPIYTSKAEVEVDDEDLASASGAVEDVGGPSVRTWKLHAALLAGNLVRILVLFHLPLCVFCVYQFSLMSASPTSTLVLTAFTFALVCVIAPLLLLATIYALPSTILYTHDLVLLSIGPLYNTYSDDCVLFVGVRFGSNLILGAVLGGIQSSGTAQAATILALAVAEALVTSLWLPWQDNSALGPLTFVLAIARITIAVLLVVLSPAVGVGAPAAAWLAYVVLLLQGILLLLLVVIVIFKLAELALRLVGSVPFDDNSASGLLGALERFTRRTRKSGQPGRSDHRRAKALQLRRGSNSGLSRQPSTPSFLDGSLTASALKFPSTAPGRLGPGEDDGFIMSAMSTGEWSGGNTSPGYIPPAVYGNYDRLAQNPSSTPARGFSRVAGSRASAGDPWSMDASQTRFTAAGYPTPRGSLSDSSRRHSQFAVIESAPAPSPPHSALSLPTSGSLTLLSNSNPRNSLDPPVVAPEPKGFLNRFRRAKPSDLSSDEEEEDDDDQRPTLRIPKLRLWPRRNARTKSTDAGGEEAELPAGAQREFVVVRKVQPTRTPPAVSPLSTTPHSISPPLESSTSGPIPLVNLVRPHRSSVSSGHPAQQYSATPHLSIQPPSPRASLISAETDSRWGNEQEGLRDGSNDQYEELLKTARGRRESH